MRSSWKEGRKYMSGRKGRKKDGRERGGERGKWRPHMEITALVSIKQHSGTKRSKDKITGRAGGTEQGHYDMCCFDDKEKRHKKDKRIKEQF